MNLPQAETCPLQMICSLPIRHPQISNQRGPSPLNQEKVLKILTSRSNHPDPVQSSSMTDQTLKSIQMRDSYSTQTTAEIRTCHLTMPTTGLRYGWTGEP